MTRSAFLTAVALLILLASAVPVRRAAADDGPREPVPEPKGDFVYHPYWGTVTALTKESITIRFDNQKDRTPRAFKASDTLAAGGVPVEPRRDLSEGYHVPSLLMYRLTDVKVGDWVLIRYARIDGQAICDHICIQKRPGGLVPPLTEEAEGRDRPRQLPGRPPRLFIPYHEYMNAYWDLVDHDTPFPVWFGDNRRWPAAPPPHAPAPAP
jgi:hypothetical protein